MENWTAEGTRERTREEEGEKRKQESVEEPYFARSSAGVQILNRILDECISLTRLRPVSSRRARGWRKRRRQRGVAAMPWDEVRGWGWF